MKPYSLIIYYNNLADLRERLHDHLEELEARAAEPAAPSIIDMPMTEIVGFLRAQGYEISAANSSAMAVAETDEEVQDAAPEPVDPEVFKETAIERLKEIYLLKGGAKLIDRLIKKHGGGEQSFMRIAADRYPMIMAEVEKEFPQ
jgi:hypothetical protein